MPTPHGRRRAPARHHARPNRGQPGSRQRPGPAPAPASELDIALAAAAASPQPSAASFAELGLDQRLVRALTARDIRAPFPIQARVLPDALAGRDVLGRAETGSGKTLAFGLPMLSRLAEGSERPRPTAPHGLVLVPTRE